MLVRESCPRLGGSPARVSSPEALLAAAVLAVLGQSAPAQLQFDELGKRALPPLGTLGIDPNNMVPLPALLMPVSGMSSVTIAVPNKPWFAGVPIYGQALLVQYPIQQHLTNVTGDVVWR